MLFRPSSTEKRPAKQSKNRENYSEKENGRADKGNSLSANIASDERQSIQREKTTKEKMFTKQSSVDMDIEFDIKLLATGFLDGTVIPLNNKLESIKLDELPIKMNKITIRKLIYGGARYVCASGMIKIVE